MEWRLCLLQVRVYLTRLPDDPEEKRKCMQAVLKAFGAWCKEVGSPCFHSADMGFGVRAVLMVRIGGADSKNEVAEQGTAQCSTTWASAVAKMAARHVACAPKS